MPISVRTPAELARLAPALRALVRTALKGEGRTAGEIGVVLADDATLRALNRQWRGLDRATDVLSFGYEERGEGPGADALPDPDAPVDGDLIVSMDRVREQARRFRVSEAEELARLVIHGVLHLAGLDHRRAAERRAMRAREDGALHAGRAVVRALARAAHRGRGRRRAVRA